MSATVHSVNSKPHKEDILWLETTLRFSNCWLHADELLVARGDAVDFAGKRWIRAVASESEWIISGNDGYKHVAHATDEEITHFVNRMKSQIDVMTVRIEAVQRNKASLN
ncbi:MAG: hypothetical protein WCH99_04150 [Verrucomicrobiota bacterium]